MQTLGIFKQKADSHQDNTEYEGHNASIAGAISVSDPASIICR
jgi:hypothetical protein